jgi:hypothetical protein
MNVDVRLLLTTLNTPAISETDQTQTQTETTNACHFESNGSCYYGEKFPLNYCSSPCNSISVVGIMLA